MARKRIGEILIQAGVLDTPGLHAALAEQRRWGGQLGRTLIEMKLVTEEALVQALSHQLNFPTVNLDAVEIAQNVLELVPGELAEQHNLIPFHREGKFLDVAMSEPTDLGVIDEIRIRTQLNVRWYLAGPKMIERALARWYGRGVATWSQVIRLPEAGQASGQGMNQPAGQGVNQSGRDERDREIRALQKRISALEAQVSRDEDVMRKVLGILVEKGIATREEILERLK
jgi:type IV pilus assembly protein PilB